MMTNVSLAYSPDTDDAFMVHALRQGSIETSGYEFSYVSDDIQRLNELALNHTFDITAISVAAYPKLKQNYWLLPIGASVGQGFGPAIVTRQGAEITQPHELASRRVAVPGLETSAYFAARILLGTFTPVAMPFDKIADAVNQGEVDGGILIHELQIDCERAGLKKIGDLGSAWQEAFDLPLPLGANAISKRFPRAKAIALARLYLNSIKYGLNHRHATLQAAAAQATVKLDHALSDAYINQYVNDDSLGLSAKVKTAISMMYERASALGLCQQIDLAHDLLPIDDEEPANDKL